MPPSDPREGVVLAPSAQPRKALVLALSLTALVFLTVASVGRIPPYLIWNASASVPLGLYLLRPGAPAGIDDLVLAWLPEAVRRTAAERGYLAANVPIIKPVAGVPGDTVCAGAEGVSVNDKAIVERLGHDRQGRPMPTWLGCKTLQENELFLLAAGITDSFDGRYFGPLEENQIVGTVVPLWTF